MKNNRIIIIGAGIAGLAAGCYAQMNGYETQIMESHSVPGGLCTAWKRQGYTFDGCLHHLAGSGPRSSVFAIWQELGAFGNRPLYFHPELTRFVSSDGQVVSIYVDPDRLLEHLNTLSPNDAKHSQAYVEASRRFVGHDLLSLPNAGPREMLGMVAFMPTFGKWMGITLEKYAEGFQSALLRQAFPTIQYDFPNMPCAINLNFLAGCSQKILGEPQGGSLQLMRSIADRYAALGGQLHLRSRVSQVLVKNDRAVGVRLEDGTEHDADTVISAADGRSTIFSLLDGKYVSPTITDYYSSAPDYQQMNVQVSLGVDSNYSKLPVAQVLQLPQPVTLSGEKVERLDVKNYGFDPTMAPVGKTVLKVLLHSRYSFWKGLSADRTRYDEEKQRTAETVVAGLEPHFAGLKQHLEVVDVATPLTTERFTGNYHGLQAWGMKGNPLVALAKGLSTTLPGLSGFYMVGQWAAATIGVSTGAINGRKLIRRLCKQDGKPFVTTRA